MFDKMWLLIVVFCALWRKNNPFRKCLKNESTWIFFVGCGEGPSLPDACPDLRARQQHRLQAAVPDTHRLRHPELPVRATQGSRLLPLNGHHAQVSQVFFCLPFCEKKLSICHESQSMTFVRDRDEIVLLRSFQQLKFVQNYKDTYKDTVRWAVLSAEVPRRQSTPSKNNWPWICVC